LFIFAPVKIVLKNIDINEFNDIFFSPIRVTYPIEKNYKESIPAYIQAARAQSMMSSACIYILDYVEKKFVYVSEKERIMCGYSNDEIEKMGIDFLKNILYAGDLDLFTKINDLGFSYFFNQIEPSERQNYWATYDLRTVTKNNDVELHNFRFFPLVVDTNGNIILAMVQINLSTNKKSGNLLIYSINEHQFFEYDDGKKRFVPVRQRLLSKKEKQMLKLFSKGLTIKEIGEALSIRPNSLSYYNKSILTKLKVENMKEAVFLYSQMEDVL